MAVEKETLKILFIIVTWNRKNQINQCLKSLITHCPLSYQILVIDNASEDGTTNLIKKQYPQVLLIENEKNLGFSKANNQGIKYALENNICSEYTIFFNNDAALLDGSIENLIAYLDKNKDIQAAIPAVFLENKNYQTGIGGYDLSLKTAFLYFFGFSLLLPRIFKGFFLHQKYFHKKGIPVEVDWISGVCLVMKSDLLKYIPKFPEEFFMYAEDVAFCQDIRKFGKIVFYPFSKVLHSKAEYNPKYLQKYHPLWIESLFRYYSTIKNKRFRSIRLLLLKLIFLEGLFLRLLVYSFIPNTKTKREKSNLKIYCISIIRSLLQSPEQ